MGWWSISKEKAGIDWTGETDTGMYNGDGPADIMGPAVDELVKLFEEEWGRKPYMAELIAAVKFVAGAHDLEESS